MKRLHFKIKNNLSQLHDELLEKIPELRPVPGRSDWAKHRTLSGTSTNQAVMVPVEGDKENVWLTVPNNANIKAIETVISAHKPTQE